MAFGAERLGAAPLALTIHIWPSRQLASQSWHWPERWHEAYVRAAGLLGLAAATCVLEGRAFDEHDVQLSQHTRGLKFVVVREGDSIHMTVLDFVGPGTEPDPHAPGPNGGARQPGPADGLVLGLRGSGRCYRLVVFHGTMPPIPAVDVLRDEISTLLFDGLDFSCGNAGAFSVADANPKARNRKIRNIKQRLMLTFGGCASPGCVRGMSWPVANSLFIFKAQWETLQVAQAMLFASNYSETIVSIRQLSSWPIHGKWQRVSLQELRRSSLRIRRKRDHASSGTRGRYLH